jgi:hypothetical protein
VGLPEIRGVISANKAGQLSVHSLIVKADALAGSDIASDTLLGASSGCILAFLPNRSFAPG